MSVTSSQQQQQANATGEAQSTERKTEIIIILFIKNDDSSIELKPDNLDEILQALDNHHYGANNYDSLGLALGLIHDKLDEIESDYPKASQRLKETIKAWLKKGKNCNWKTLVAAVRRDNNAAADAIAAELSKSYVAI